MNVRAINECSLNFLEVFGGEKGVGVDPDVVHDVAA